MRTEPVAAFAALDTVEIFVPGPPGDARAEIERAMGGRRVRFDEKPYGRVIKINRPPLDRLPALEAVRRKYNGAIHRYDVAVDIMFATDADADRGGQEMDRSIVVKWRARGADTWQWSRGDGFSWVFAPGKRRAGRWLNRYRKTETVQRLELRFTCAASVRRSGIKDLRQLARINPAELFAHHAKFIGWKPAYHDKVVRRAVETHRSSSRFPYDAARSASSVLDRQYMQDAADRRRIEPVSFPVPDALGPYVYTS